METNFDPDSLRNNIASMEQEMLKPGFWDAPDDAQKLMKRKKISKVSSSGMKVYSRDLMIYLR